jgi:hypothetical protein
MHELLLDCRQALLNRDFQVVEEWESGFGVANKDEEWAGKWLVEIERMEGRGEDDEEHITAFLLRQPSAVNTKHDVLLAMLNRLAHFRGSSIDRVSFLGACATFRWKREYWKLSVR